jgi:hypothetical protein
MRHIKTVFWRCKQKRKIYGIYFTPEKYKNGMMTING